MNTNNKIFDRFSVMIIGDEKVSKSSLIERYTIIFTFKLDISIESILTNEKEL